MLRHILQKRTKAKYRSDVVTRKIFDFNDFQESTTQLLSNAFLDV